MYIFVIQNKKTLEYETRNYEYDEIPEAVFRMLDSSFILISIVKV